MTSNMQTAGTVAKSQVRRRTGARAISSRRNMARHPAANSGGTGSMGLANNASRKRRISSNLSMHPRQRAKCRPIRMR
jgi:hypothetical protein